MFLQTPLYRHINSVPYLKRVIAQSGENLTDTSFWKLLQRSYLPPASEWWGKVIFSVCVSVHTSTGGVLHPLMGGTPFPGPGGGYPFPGAGRGYPFPGLNGGVPPPGKGVPPAWEGGYPPTWEWVPPSGKGYPLGWGYPPVQVRSQEQHSVYLLRGRQCASCVHAGGLSCSHTIWLVFVDVELATQC